MLFCLYTGLAPIDVGLSFIVKKFLPRRILLFPSKLALKSLQACCLGSNTFKSATFRESLGFKNKDLLGICQDLGTEGYYLAGIAPLNKNSLLDEHVKCISNTLPDDIILKLALLTCHFNASSQSPSKELLEFFSHPEDNVNAMCQIFCGRYSAYTGRYMRWSEFGEEFAFNLGILEFAMVNGWYLILHKKSPGLLYTNY